MDPGQKLGKYELLELVGKGAMGVVYRARDPDIERTVAIKTVRKELIEDDERAGMILARFKNEARAAGRLSHPGIVAVYDYGESDTVAYISMEFVQGNSLREYFNRGVRFSDADILSIMVQLLEALAHAHEQGVWHRDIKPANLIIMKNGRVKVADFGIARIEASQLTQTGMLMGSQGYMAPEQYGGGKVDQRADLFAAGVVLYQLLTSQRPFNGTTEQIVYQICHAEPPAPSAAEPGKHRERYDTVVARALAKKPEERFQTALEFRDALLAAYGEQVKATVSEETVVALPARPAVFEPSNASWRTPSLAHAPAKPAPSPGPALFSKPALIAAATAVVAAVTVGGMFWRKEEPPAPQASAPVVPVQPQAAPPEPSVQKEAPAAAPAAAPEPKQPEVAAAAPASAPQPKAPEPAPAEKISEPAAPQEAKAEEAPAPAPAPPKPKARAPKRSTAVAAVSRKETTEPAPAPAEEAEAYVVFTIKPKGSVVFVDGERRGTIPPLTQLRLAPGDHRIEIQNGKRQPYISDINLQPDDRLHIQYSFR